MGKEAWPGEGLVLELRFEVVWGCEPVVFVVIVSAVLAFLIVKTLAKRILACGILGPMMKASRPRSGVSLTLLLCLAS
jgi:hypothetical protein